MTRTEAWCRLFGWQGGTIWLVAEATKCQAHDLLYSDEPADQSAGSSYMAGWFAAKMALTERGRQQDFRGRRGNVAWWLGAAAAVQQDVKKLILI